MATFQTKTDGILRGYLDVNSNRIRIDSQPEKHLLIEALFLRAVVEAELTLDKFFWDLLAGKIPLGSSIQTAVQFPNEEIAKRIVNAGKYLNWFPAKEISNFTEPYFISGNPFKGIDPFAHELAIIHKIRNFIAHRSETSLNGLDDCIPKAYRPTDTDDTIARYLKSPHTTEGTKFEFLLSILRDWVGSVCN